jgi:putative transposase
MSCRYNNGMSSRRSVNLGGWVYHVLNRSNARFRMFRHEGDYLAFCRTLAEAQHVAPMRILGYCVMPNHWHLLLCPLHDGDLSRFMHWLTMTHARRYRSAHRNVGTGHLYQGRYRSFPVEQSAPTPSQQASGVVETANSLLRVLRYIERNPAKARLVGRAEQWRYSSAFQRLFGTPDPDESTISLSDLPGVRLPDDWLVEINRRSTKGENQSIETNQRRSRPLGSEQWANDAAKLHRVQSSLKPLGRPKTKG